MPFIDEVPQELPLQKGADNFYIARLYDGATGAPLSLSVVKEIKCVLRDKRNPNEAQITIPARVTGLNNKEGEVLVCVPADKTENLKAGTILYADLRVILVTGHEFNKPVGGQAFRVIEVITTE